MDKVVNAGKLASLLVFLPIRLDKVKIYKYKRKY